VLGLALCINAFFLIGAAAVNRDLEGIKKKIENEKKGLSRLQAKEGSVLQSLGKIENELDRKSKQLKLANAEFFRLAGEMAAKKAEAARLNSSVALRQQLLQKRAVALYRWYRGGSPFVLLNGDTSWVGLLRRKRYLETAISFDREWMTRLQEERQQQLILHDELARKKIELDDQKQALGLAKDAVLQEAAKKKIVLAAVRREKEVRLRALKEMEGAALRLQKMMDELSRRAAIRPRESPPSSSTGTGLDALRGRLDWPVRGEVIAPFGKFKHPEFAAEVVRKGIDIEAPFGEGIRAIEKGKIVYAGRFSGYGKMVIIDHGERYYTIYGHLSEILKKTGDEVGRGDILGRVGDSDSLAGAKLYFEIRKDGRSMDPVPWFKK
jgi:septal ring factor EnvC (AmiA/AmiB activator)